MKRVCVYCASSPRIAPVFFEATDQLGQLLANQGIEVVYGGGGQGLMGQLADSMLQAGGRIKGVMPLFMKEAEWGHSGLTELQFTQTMHERKARFLVDIDGIIALPGGCGTLEELLEAITLKRLGLLNVPIVILNTNGFYDPLHTMLARCIEEQFMPESSNRIWQFVQTPLEVIPALKNAPEWADAALKSAKRQKR